MAKTGPFVREKFPKTYKFLVGIINGFKRIGRPYTIYITDSLGGSFKSYFVNSDMSEKISQLKRNLDEDSIKTIDVIIQRLLNYPDERYKYKLSRHREIIGGLLPVETDPGRKLINNRLKNIKDELKLMSGQMEESVFYFNHGLKLLPEEISKYINDTDFIDAGAYTGDSAIALREYKYRKIYSFEISKKSIERYRQNMKAFNVSPDKFEIINVCIASDDTQPPVTFADTGSAGLSFMRKTGKYDYLFVEQKSIDYLADKYEIYPRFIKVDIEGNSLELIKGAKKTLLKYRPVLSVAIYHNPYEFFEVKPFLENLLQDYVFIIRKLSSGIRNNHCHSEVILIGYPSEIIRRNNKDANT